MLESCHNRYPDRLAAELDAAQRVWFVPVEVPGREFDALAAEGQTMIYVLVDDRLLVSKRQVLGEHITHAVLAGGEPVQAAGEFDVQWQSGGAIVARLNNVSGHYRPARASLAVARAAFEARGLPVRAGGVQDYDRGSL